MKSQPKYRAIAETLRDAIERGDLAPGQALPSQRDLAETHGVTVMTVRQALAGLAEDGLIGSEHGRGTFVAPRAFALPLGPLSSLVDEAAAAGRELTTTVLGHGPDPEAIGDHPAYRIERLRRLDGLPFALQTSRLPRAVADRIHPAALAEHALYELLATAGLEVVQATETIRAVNLDAESAVRLEREPGAAALLSIRESRLADGRVVVSDRGLVPGDVGVLSIERARLQPAPTTSPAPDRRRDDASR